MKRVKKSILASGKASLAKCWTLFILGCSEASWHLRRALAATAIKVPKASKSFEKALSLKELIFAYSQLPFDQPWIFPASFDHFLKRFR